LVLGHRHKPYASVLALASIGRDSRFRTEGAVIPSLNYCVSRIRSGAMPGPLRRCHLASDGQKVFADGAEKRLVFAAAGGRLVGPQ